MRHSNTILKDDLDSEPWYKQGWPWALIAIPFLTVIAGVITFKLALDSSDGLVQDDYYKKGLAINRNLDKLDFAKKMDVKVKLTIDRNSSLIFMKLLSKSDVPSSVILRFAHPTQKEKDKEFLFSHLNGEDYVADLSEISPGYWHVSLTDEKNQWIVKSRWLYPDKMSIQMNAND
jgi:uncharacterized protein